MEGEEWKVEGAGWRIGGGGCRVKLLDSNLRGSSLLGGVFFGSSPDGGSPDGGSLRDRAMPQVRNSSAGCETTCEPRVAQSMLQINGFWLVRKKYLTLQRWI